jgi:transcriptional regulator with XRE-family HTH domain
MDERAVAAAAGVSLATARRWLRGAQLPTLPAAVRLAEALAVPVHFLAPTPAQQAREGLADLSRTGAAGRPRRGWSVSKVRDYLRCPAYFYFRHVAEVPEPPRADPILGHAVHRAIEAVYGALRHPDGTPADPREVLRRDLEDNLPDEAAAAGGDGEEGGEAELICFDDLADEGEALLALYRREVADRIRPRAVEQRAEVEVAGVPFTVVADVITDDGFVRDTKVSRRRPSEDDVAEDLQATAESLAYRRLHGEPERGIIFDYLLRHKKGPVHVAMPTTRTECDHARLARIVGGGARGVLSQPGHQVRLCLLPVRRGLPGSVLMAAGGAP